MALIQSRRLPPVLLKAVGSREQPCVITKLCRSIPAAGEIRLTHSMTLYPLSFPETNSGVKMSKIGQHRLRLIWSCHYSDYSMKGINISALWGWFFGHATCKPCVIYTVERCFFQCYNRENEKKQYPHIALSHTKTRKSHQLQTVVIRWHSVQMVHRHQKFLALWPSSLTEGGKQICSKYTWSSFLSTMRIDHRENKDERD